MTPDAKDSAADPQHLPYQEVTDPTYAEQAARTFQIIDAGSVGRLLRGPCPRCSTVFDVTLFDGIFEGQRTIAPAPATFDQDPTPTQPSAKIEPIACLCRDAHAGRPDGVTEGCGAYWNLVIAAGTS